jgi:hypothetical protein
MKLYLKKTTESRKAFIGYGQRSDFTKLKNIAPPPNTYNLKSFVDIQTSRKKGVRIGKRFKPPNYDKIPGPGKYKVRSRSFDKRGTIIGRQIKHPKELNLDKRVQENPGPGTYPTFTTMNQTGQ